MKAVVMGTSAKQAFVKEVEDAKADQEHVLIQVEKVAICGSDKHTWVDGSLPNAIVGHEYSGVVLDPGPRTDLKVGDHVTSVTQNPCMQCEYCKEGHNSYCSANAWFPGGGQIPGVFAEKFAARADLVYKMDESLTFEEGALTEPVAVCWHALKKSGLKPGGKLLISGVGSLTAFTAQLARHMGASMVVATGSSRKRAQSLLDNKDLDEFVNPREAGFVSKLLELSGGGFDAYVDAKGDIEGINQHLCAVKKGGICVTLGINMGDKNRLNIFDLMMNEHALVGSFAYDNDEFAECLQLMAEKKIDPAKYAGRCFPMEQVQEAFVYSDSRDTLDLKILMEP